MKYNYYRQNYFINLNLYFYFIYQTQHISCDKIYKLAKGL